MLIQFVIKVWEAHTRIRRLWVEIPVAGSSTHRPLIVFAQLANNVAAINLIGVYTYGV